MDKRTLQLARCIMQHSLKITAGENVFLECRGMSTLPLLRALIVAATEAGAVPYYSFNDPSLEKEFIATATAEQMQAKAALDLAVLQKCSAYVGARAEDDPFWMADVAPSQQELYKRFYTGPVHMDWRIPKMRWCVLRYPSPIKAASSKMSLKGYTDFFFDVCLVDYDKMHRAALPLLELFNRTDKVRIVAPGTDLTFSLKGQKATICYGLCNIPDGEVYSSPVRESVNGKVRFNTETMQNGVPFANISLTFENGKVVDADCLGSKAELNRVLDVDEGARFVGEFAFGINPKMNRVMQEGLFDEKIAGSFHMALGNQLPKAPNGNFSSIHWDLIQIQTPQFGGGEVYFDDVLIRKDGMFLLDELKALNPENLV